MKNVAFLLAAAAALIAALDLHAQAGARMPEVAFPVEIRKNADGSGFMRGVPSQVFRTDSRTELIHCAVQHFDGGRSSALCTAKEVQGPDSACSTQDPDLVDAIAHLDPSDRWAISWDRTGKCSFVMADKGSMMGPF